MGLRINHNITALNAWRNLTTTDANFSKSLERLSSGYRINKAADDPAGLAISQQMRSQIAGLEQAINNSEAAINMVQTGEGYLEQIHNLLIDIRSLALHAANEGANDETQLAADQQQINEAISTISNIARDAQFGTKKLLDGSAGIKGATSNNDVAFIGATKNVTTGTYTIAITQQAQQATIAGDVDRSAGLTSKANVVINGVQIELDVSMATTPGLLTIGDITNLINAKTTSTGVEATHDGTNIDLTSIAYGSTVSIAVTDQSAVLFSTGNGAANGATTITYDFIDVGQNIDGTFTDLSTSLAYQANGTGTHLVGEAGTPVDSLEIASALAAGDAGSVTVENNSLTFQVGANKGQTVLVALMNASATQLGSGLGIEGNLFSSLAEIDVTIAGGGEDALTVVQKAIDDISNLRAGLGALQKNYLESSISTLRVASQNLSAAESTIRDTDMAREIAEFTKLQILMQAGTAMLAQANLVPQTVLQLLQ